MAANAWLDGSHPENLKYHIFVIALSDWHVSANPTAGLDPRYARHLNAGAGGPMRPALLVDTRITKPNAAN